MKRYLTSLLLAYAIAMTLLVIWVGSYAVIYWGLISGLMKINSWSPITHAQVMANTGATTYLKGPLNESALLIANVEPPALASVIFLITLTCLGFAHRRRPKQVATDIKKD